MIKVFWATSVAAILVATSAAALTFDGGGSGFHEDRWDSADPSEATPGSGSARSSGVLSAVSVAPSFHALPVPVTGSTSTLLQPLPDITNPSTTIVPTVASDSGLNMVWSTSAAQNSGVQSATSATGANLLPTPIPAGGLLLLTGLVGLALLRRRA